MQNAVYMQRALELAVHGMEWVSPNPMVGCVIVHNDKIIGEGFHQKYGDPHAEVNAINEVKDKSLLPDSTAFVTLEPCSHYGKTPPCADLLIQSRIGRVVIATTDPYDKVAGKGIKKLQDAGIKVEVGLCQREARELNKRFFKAVKTGLPYIVLKWAETTDGFLAHQDGAPLRISNEVTDITVHRWRAEEDGILVGKNTVLTDNPRLNVRHWTGNIQPVRIILDSNLEIPEDKNIYDGSLKTIIVNKEKEGSDEKINYLKSNQLVDTLKQLKRQGVHSILVEGGLQTHQSFIGQKLFDEIRVIKGNVRIGDGIPAPKIPAGISLKEIVNILDDKIFHYEIPLKYTD